MTEPKDGHRDLRETLARLERTVSSLGTDGVYEPTPVPPIPEADAWWRSLDHVPSGDEWLTIEDAIRSGERARLVALIESRIGAIHPFNDRVLWEVIALING